MRHQQFEKTGSMTGKGRNGSHLLVPEPGELPNSTRDNESQPNSDWAAREAQQMETFHQAVKEMEFLEASIASVHDLKDSIAHVVVNFKNRITNLHGTTPRLYPEVKDIHGSFLEFYDRFIELLDTKLLQHRHNHASCSILVVDFKTRVEKLQDSLPPLYLEVKDIQQFVANRSDTLLIGKELLEKRYKVSNKQYGQEKDDTTKSGFTSSQQMSRNPSSEGEPLTRVTTLDENDVDKLILEVCDRAIPEGKKGMPPASSPCEKNNRVDMVEVISNEKVDHHTPDINNHPKQPPSIRHLEAATTLCVLNKSANTVRKMNKYEKKRAQKARNHARDAELLKLALAVKTEKAKNSKTSALNSESPPVTTLWQNVDNSTPRCNKFNYGGYLFWVPDRTNSAPKLPSCLYTVQTIKGKGDGVVATGAIHKYSRFMQERFLFLVERKMFSEPDEIPTDGAIKAFLQACLTHEEAELFMRLGNSIITRADYLGRLATNKELVRMEQTGNADASEAIPMFPNICKINHSCCPNSFFSWNTTLGCGVIHALRDIEQGEEITIAYKDMALQDFETRKTQLDLRWGIECNCQRCSMSFSQRALDDKRMHDLIKELNFFEFKLHDVENEGTPTLSAKILSTGKRIQHLLALLATKQDLACLAAEWSPKVYYYLTCVAMSHTDIMRSTFFAQNAALFYRMYRGSCFAADVMDALQANPKMHHRWGMYSSNWYQDPGQEFSQVALTVREDGEEVYVEVSEGLKDEERFSDWLYRSDYEKQGLIR